MVLFFLVKYVIRVYVLFVYVVLIYNLCYKDLLRFYKKKICYRKLENLNCLYSIGNEYVFFFYCLVGLLNLMIWCVIWYFLMNLFVYFNLKILFIIYM